MKQLFYFIVSVLNHNNWKTYMKRILILILLVTAFVACNAQSPEAVIAKDHSIDTNKVIVPGEYYGRVDQVITQLLTKYHYKRQSLNDSLSSVIFDNYINTLDNNKMYFYKADIDRFEQYRNVLDDSLYAGKLGPAYDIFNVFKKRLGERVKYIHERLAKEFNFEKNESFTPDRKDAPWAKDAAELDEIWRKRLKNDELNMIVSGKDWKAASDVLVKRYDNFYKLILQYEAEDVFQLYMNSLADSFDPHSNYFSPIASDNFNINMSLSLEGIGATLKSENDYTVVASIVPGGPAFKSGLLHDGDKIVGVAQGEDGEMVDVIGWRLDDAIQLIRGKKGTLVRLSIIKATAGINDPPEEIKIVRDKVKLEEAAAKQKIINVNENGADFKLGVIELPSFYVDFEGQRRGDPDYKSTTRDVKKILDNFKKEKVDGVIIDLRGNGGGSLQEAVSLTGLFIKDGPVVQVKNSNGAIEVDKDPDASVYYNGPLAVMTDRQSASASEIFAGAIQDYGRGLILGENTYGKGTVQNMVDLNRFLPSVSQKLGDVKLTIAKFYRITGSSTQNKGVIPDITYPSAFPADEYGESTQPSALKWDQIAPTDFTKYNEINKVLPELLKKHEERIKKDPDFNFVLEDIKEREKDKNKKSFSLKIEDRKKEREEAEAKKKERDELKQKNLKLVEKTEVDTLKKPIEDYELRESGHILADFILAKIG